MAVLNAAHAKIVIVKTEVDERQTRMVTIDLASLTDASQNAVFLLKMTLVDLKEYVADEFSLLYSI